jgi:hypothetical protein
MAVPAYALTSYTGTTDPAGDIVALIEAQLTSAGWTFVEQTGFTQAATPRYLRVWKCPAALNIAGVDFYVGLVKNQAAGTYLAARAFEGYNSTNHTMQRPCISGTAVQAPSGVSLTPRTTISNAGTDMTYGAGMFVGVGGTTTAQSSPDGITWTTRTLPTSQTWLGVAFGNAKFVAVGGRGAAAAPSSDGITWAAATMPASTNWASCAYGNSIWVAVGATTVAASAPDPTGTWTARTLPTSQTWKDVAFGGGIFVAIGGTATAAASSTDGQTWTARTMPAATTWGSVAYGNGVFVAINNANTQVAATSPDGINWTQRTLPVTASWAGIAFGNGIFVATGGNGTIATSTDGITWVNRTNPAVSTGLVIQAYGSAATGPIGATWAFFGTSTIGYTSPLDTTLPYHAGTGDWPADASGVPAIAELLPNTALAVSTNYDVGVLVSKSYLVLGINTLGTTTSILSWVIGLYAPAGGDSQSAYPPLAVVDMKNNAQNAVSGTSRSMRVILATAAFCVGPAYETVLLGILAGAVAEPTTASIRASRVVLGGAVSAGVGLGFTGVGGGAYRGRLYDVVAVSTGNTTATVTKIGDSVTIGGVTYTALGPSSSSGGLFGYTGGCCSWFFNTAAGT